MKKLYISTILCIIALVSYLYSQNNGNDRSYSSSLTLMNVEALADTESSVDHYWCCGNTGTCVKGDNFEIKGEFQSSPCP